jgi:hypothetical protein
MVAKRHSLPNTRFQPIASLARSQRLSSVQLAQGLISLQGTPYGIDSETKYLTAVLFGEDCHAFTRFRTCVSGLAGSGLW